MIINRKLKMAALDLHIRKGNFDIFCKCCSYKGKIIITVFWVDK